MEAALEISAQQHYDRVREMTPEKVNQKLDQATERMVRAVSSEGPHAIRHRLDELDREWDIDRVLMVNFALFVFPQLLMAKKNRNWLWGPIFQTPFLFMHAVLGWCPPSLWFRPLGFRTRKEIQSEREALLKVLYSKNN